MLLESESEGRCLFPFAAFAKIDSFRGPHLGLEELAIRVDPSVPLSVVEYRRTDESSRQFGVIEKGDHRKFRDINLGHG